MDVGPLVVADAQASELVEPATRGNRRRTSRRGRGGAIDSSERLDTRQRQVPRPRRARQVSRAGRNHERRRTLVGALLRRPPRETVAGSVVTRAHGERSRRNRAVAECAAGRRPAGSSALKPVLGSSSRRRWSSRIFLATFRNGRGGRWARCTQHRIHVPVEWALRSSVWLTPGLPIRGITTTARELGIRRRRRHTMDARRAFRHVHCKRR